MADKYRIEETMLGHWRVLEYQYRGWFRTKRAVSHGIFPSLEEAEKFIKGRAKPRLTVKLYNEYGEEDTSW